MTRIAHSVTARLLAAALLLVSSSCDSESGGGTHVVLISEMRMVLGTDDDGSLRGMNLDDRVDEVGSPDTCNKVDGVAPDGTPGIDNQFSILGGLVVSQLGGNADALIQSSINDGRLLILLELLNVDNLENDNDVTVRIHVGSGPVDVGTNGRPEPGQSFDISEMSAPIEVRDVRIVDGRIDIHPFDINVNVDILQAMFFLTLLESRIQVDLREDGSGTGVLGAGVDSAMILDIIANDEVLMPTLGAVRAVLRGLGDLQPNDIGGCDRVSVGIEIDVVPAFILR
ncbi:MAG: hypothetical protein IPI43_10495 [Sandaracinaceae bacterium]|jgi:hypothetical protein|nr:hypothetical protein [Sandaracinaceae bacterium]MBK7774554.1 hypothetical protein [Sandaracinaceae bacterium]MBK8589690.1 hypothetical protein [Sandaracinaceae bacterium]MBP7683290.1 hypothetical protein [Deltaproteobacteria bacterium]